MHRQIILDTETTGLDTTRNHKIIEIGCIEIIDRKYTGKDFHFYLNPNRKIDQGAINIHGIISDLLDMLEVEAHFLFALCCTLETTL